MATKLQTTGTIVLVAVLFALAMPLLLEVRPTHAVTPGGPPAPGSVTPTSFSPGDNPPISPFAGVRFEPGRTDVLVYGAWYTLISIEGVPAKDIEAFARRRHGTDWKKRFCEDLVWVLDEMGHFPPPAVDLVLQARDTGAMVRLDDVIMTHENRQQVRNTWR